MKDRTALAEAEVEYADHTSPSIWVRFALTTDPALIHADLAGRKVFGLIWTTTPWTMPANMAIAYNPKFEYVGGGGRRRRLHCRRGSAQGYGGEMRLGRAESVGARFTGAKMEARGVPASVPGARFAGNSGGPRDAGAGNGRGAYGAGAWAGRLRQRPAVRDSDLLSGGCGGAVLSRRRRAGTAAGRDYREDGVGSEPDCDRDSEGARGAAAARRRSRIRYPHCWRCHNATIFRATEQWFIGMEKQRPAAARARSDPAREVDAGVGRGAHLEHDCSRGPTGASRGSACGACRSWCFIARRAASR